MSFFRKLFGASDNQASDRNAFVSEPANEDDKFARNLGELKVMVRPTSFTAWKHSKMKFTVVNAGASARDVIQLMKSNLRGATLPDLRLTNEIFGFSVGGLEAFESKGNGRYLTGKFGVVRLSSSCSNPAAVFQGNMYTDKSSDLYIFRFARDQFMCVRCDEEIDHPAEW